MLDGSREEEEGCFAGRGVTTGSDWEREWGTPSGGKSITFTSATRFLSRESVDCSGGRGIPPVPMAVTVPGPGLSAVRSSSVSGEDGREVVGGGHSRRVGELEADACRVGEGVAAAMDANVLDKLVHADAVGRADVAETTVCESLALVKPAVETGLTCSLDTAGGRFTPPALLGSGFVGTTSEYRFPAC